MSGDELIERPAVTALRRHDQSNPAVDGLVLLRRLHR
jgi:hypothetical protein